MRVVAVVVVAALRMAAVAVVAGRISRKGRD
jgi:hypothetical protein